MPSVTPEGVGLEPGTRLVAYLRVPGETRFSQAAVRAEVQDDGTFTWQRRTGKRTSVYFSTEDGSVRSERVIIPGR